jgi:hypothetical protein
MAKDKPFPFVIDPNPRKNDIPAQETLQSIQKTIPSAISIVSDGSVEGTRVLCNGRVLGLVQKVTWEIAMGDELATATVQFVNVPVNVVGTLKT